MNCATNSEQARNCIYLSPHHDDACFSIGSIIRAIASGELINVFSTSDYTDPTHRLGNEPWEISKIRNSEDQVFARTCGVRSKNLGQLESPLRKRAPFDTSELFEEAKIFLPVLVSCLESFQSKAVRPLLFCPAGIGGHRDHLILFNVVLFAYKELTRSFDILFYEDLPYASRKNNRIDWARNWQPQLRANGYHIRYRLDATDEKLALVRIYESQFDRPASDLSLFSPADGSSSPHEAIWANKQICLLEDIGASSQYSSGPSSPIPK